MMASSDSSRDGSNNGNKNNNNDNIFVQFRRNVDHQISAVLSGFIGVPSHMRRMEREEDNRWQDIEDDRQRRIDERNQDEQSRASQEHQLSPPAASNSGLQADQGGQGHSVPVKKYRLPAQEILEKESKCPHYDYDNDLFSPFTADELERLTAACRIERPAHLHILSGVQERFLASLKDTSHGSQISEMAKEKTLMPYLLFSDYSPLRLTHLPPLRRRDMPRMLEFSYAEAFEDLLETSKNGTSSFDPARDSLLSAFGVPSVLNEQWTLSLNQALGRPFSRRPMRSPLTAMEWIATSLVEKDILREKTLYETIETPIGTFRAGQYSATTEVLLNWLEYKHAYEVAIGNPHEHASDATESPFKWPKEPANTVGSGAAAERKTPRTEQEMYDDFFSTPPAARVKYMDPTEENDQLSTPNTAATPTDTATSSSFGTQTSVLDHTPPSSPPDPELHKNPWSWSSVQKPAPSSAEEKVILISNVPGQPVSTGGDGDGDGLVAHEVSEERETLADGTVKSTVITKKRFADGKSQVVISTSFDRPAERGRDSDGDGVGGGGEGGKEDGNGKGVLTRVVEWLWK